jgi:hypothetical protein
MPGLAARPAACPLTEAAFFGPAIDLLEHVRHNAEERNDEAGKGEEKADGLPQGAIAGKTGLIAVADESHAAGDESKKQESCGKDVEITGHFF